MTPMTPHQVADAAWSDSEPEPESWSSGPWSLERRGDELADVRFNGRLVVRSLRAVARDRDWRTVSGEAMRVSTEGDGLSVEVRLRGLGADFHGLVTVRADGTTLSLTLELAAQVRFDRNRLGLIVLIPPTVSGAAMRVTHPDGSVEHTRFATDISPHQPARDIAGLGWDADGLAIETRFGGEVFEMEDQRNWTDASYKVYSTPLSEPFPVTVREGETIRHTLEITVREVAPARVTSSADDVVLSLAGHPVPLIGTSASTAPDPLPPARPAADFILVEPVPSTANWRLALARAASEARAAGLALDVRIASDDPREVTEVVAELVALRDGGVPILRLGVFSPRSHLTTPEVWEALTAASAGLDAELVGGARSHFTELNRGHDALPASLSAVTFSSTPQMHAIDRAQLVEAIPMQRLTALQAVRLAGGRPVHVGPITLRSRFNAVATTPPAVEPDDLATGYGPHRVEGATDPRQRSQALAAWTIASAAAFAVAGVASLTFFETVGPRGVRDLADHPYPVHAALTALHEIAGRPQLSAVSTPEGIAALGAADAAGTVVLVASLRATAASVHLRFGQTVERIDLAPFGVARIELAPQQ